MAIPVKGAMPGAELKSREQGASTSEQDPPRKGSRKPLLPKLAKIERQTLGEQVYQELKDWVITARAIPGERMSLRTLADAIGVSAMPVREAINRLVAENALEVLPNRSFRVPVMSPSRFAELRMIRCALEGMACELAAKRRTEAELVEIARHLSRYENESRRKRPDPSVAIGANRDFHFSIYRAAKSPALFLMIEGLWLQIGGVMNLALRARPERLHTVVAHQHHARLLAALKAQDPVVAREAVIADLMSAGDEILSRTSHEAAELRPAADKADIGRSNQTST